MYGKTNGELVERPELTVHKMTMVSKGQSGMMTEYDGISTDLLTVRLLEC